MMKRYYKCKVPGCGWYVRLDGRKANQARDAHIEQHRAQGHPGTSRQR